MHRQQQIAAISASHIALLILLDYSIRRQLLMVHASISCLWHATAVIWQYSCSGSLCLKTANCSAMQMHHPPAISHTMFAFHDAVRVPAPLRALMSAQPIEAHEYGPTPYLDAHPRDDSATYYFKQHVPIPSYLLALAVGELESRELGPISRVST